MCWPGTTGPRADTDGLRDDVGKEVKRADQEIQKNKVEVDGLKGAVQTEIQKLQDQAVIQEGKHQSLISHAKEKFQELEV